MIRATFLFATASEEDTNAWFSSFLPMIEQLPGLQRYEHTAVIMSATGTLPAGTLVDVYFEDEASMNTAFASAVGKHISRSIVSPGIPLLDMLTSEVQAPHS